MSPMQSALDIALAIVIGAGLSYGLFKWFDFF